jgi:hypothetical protein
VRGTSGEADVTGNREIEPVWSALRQTGSLVGVPIAVGDE